MNKSISKKEIKNYSRDFRTVANRVLTSDFDVFDSNLKRLVSCIEKDSIIKKYILSCISEQDNFDIENDVKQVSNGFGKYSFYSFIEEEKEVSYTYQVLKYITENNISFRGYIYPYSISKQYQDKVKGFNDKVILPFVNAIDGNFERICVEMGYDEENKYNITITGGQVNIAKDNSIINATQNNYSEFDELVNEIKNNIDTIQDSELKSEIIDNVEGIQEEIHKNNIKKGRIKSFISSLQVSLPNLGSAIEVSAAITQIIAFAQGIIK